jgi:hypothetical protein
VTGLGSSVTAQPAPAAPRAPLSSLAAPGAPEAAQPAPAAPRAPLSSLAAPGAPIRPCGLHAAHEAHERTTGELPARCPGTAPEWPGEPVIGAGDAGGVELRRFGPGRPGPALVEEGGPCRS